MPTEGDHLHVFIDDDAVRAVVQSDAKAFEDLWWGKKLAGVRVSLAQAKPVAMRDLLQASGEGRPQSGPRLGRNGAKHEIYDLFQRRTLFYERGRAFCPEIGLVGSSR